MALFDDTFAPYVPFGSRNLSLQAPQMRGTDVAVLQVLLTVAQRVLVALDGGPVPITGVFDAATQAAVRNYQTYFSLSPDGIVGPATFFAFGQGVRGNVTYGGPAYGSRQLSQGMSGGDVTVLQNRLNTFGPLASIIGGPATGTYGASTTAAVLAFKRIAEGLGDTGFPANGIAGYGFYDASWIYTFAGGRGLLVGSGRNGLDVAFVQTVLADNGYYTGHINGYYDAATVAAVQAFQRAVGITADGNVGQSTFYRLGLANQQNPPAPFPVAWPATPPPPGNTVCSIALTTATSDLHPFGAAVIVTNGAEGFESLDVVGNNLPDPTTFGATYTSYAFTLSNPSGGSVIASQLMVPLPGEMGDWGGSYSVGVATIPKGQVTVYPTTDSSPTGPYGPAVLQGNLQNCT